MRILEYMKIHSLETDEDLRLHLKENLQTGKLPVALASCLKCGTIFEEDYICPNDKCKECNQ